MTRRQPWSVEQVRALGATTDIVTAGAVLGIGRTTAWEGFGDVDLVVEAAIEELEQKRAIFRELDRRTRPEAVLATNTSSLSVRQLHEGLTHPGRVAGLHFFNPVHKMPLVEVVRGPVTEEPAVATLTQSAVTIVLMWPLCTILGLIAAGKMVVYAWKSTGSGQ